MSVYVPDPNLMIAALAALLGTAAPWIRPESIFATQPPIGTKIAEPFAVFGAPTHSAAHGESGQIVNRPGQPNVYSVVYCETRYVGNAQRTAEMRRVFDTYRDFAGQLVLPYGEDGCLPNEAITVFVELKTREDGAYLTNYLGDQWIGGIILVGLNEHYGQ